MENKMNYYYYSHYNGSCSTSDRLQNKDHRMSPPPPKQDEQAKMRVRRVQVVYYLSRNGQLEHPHFMELTLSSPYLRLKDVLERLSALRGKDMPALYSWSCKRSYKHGYVWNDLTPNDVVYPTQGADEYVLKGSLLPEQSRTRTEPESEHDVLEEDDNSNSNSNSNSRYSFSITNTPPSRCSVGISTDDIHEDYSPPPLSASSCSSSDRCIVEPSRNSVLLQLVACVGSNRCGMRSPKQIGNKEESRVVTTAVVVCRSPLKNKVDVDVEGEDEAMIKCMSENPRFGGFQTENKEYFSGSIIEAVAAEERVAGEPSILKRSNSFNEERNKKESGGEEDEERAQRGEEVNVERQIMVMTGKCVPRRKKKQADHAS